MRSTRTRTCLALLAAILLALSGGAPAQATFHLNMIREFGAGNFGAGFNDSYVELQAYAAGQNHVAGHTLNVWGHNDTMPTPTTFSADVANGQNQATILIGDTSVANADGTNMALNTIQQSGGGMICWENLDCITVGTGPAAGVVPPSPVGNPAPFPFTGEAIRRTITRGCATALDPADDTNDGSDFTKVTPNPRNNASPITEKPCTGTGNGGGKAGDPNTKIKKRPKNKSDDTSPTFKFKSTEAGSTFKCKLDHKRFRKCKSPKTFHGLDPGKHKFKVEAVDKAGNVDKTPAKDTFKVLGG
jgi:hypothetical protein